MKAPGDLVHDAPYALSFRTLEPRAGTPRRLLVLLHGVGGDEFQLADLGAGAGDGTLVVLPRGPRSISGGMLGWFRVGLSDDGPQVVAEEAEDARRKLVEFVGQLQGRFDVPASRTVLAGFSQGGVLAASAVLTTPACAAGVALVCGRVLPEIEPRLAPAHALAGLDALIVHGRRDDTLPVEWAERAARCLTRLGIAHALYLHDAGHELTAGMKADVLRWFDDPARRWNAPGASSGD